MICERMGSKYCDICYDGNIRWRLQDRIPAPSIFLADSLWNEIFWKGLLYWPVRSNACGEFCKGKYFFCNHAQSSLAIMFTKTYNLLTNDLWKNGLKNMWHLLQYCARWTLASDMQCKSLTINRGISLILAPNSTSSQCSPRSATQLSWKESLDLRPVMVLYSA